MIASVSSLRETDRPLPAVVLRVKPEGPKGLGQTLRSIPGGVLEMFKLWEPMPGEPGPVILPEDVPAAAQPLPRSMSAPYKATPFFSTSPRGIWNSRD